MDNMHLFLLEAQVIDDFIIKGFCVTPEQMHSRLLEQFPGSECEVTDLTGTQDHYQVFIRSKEFKDQSRIARHQLVMKVFDEELKTGEVHALTIRTDVP